MINSFDGIKKSAQIVTKMGRGYTPTVHHFKKIEIVSNRNVVQYPTSVVNGEAYADLALQERTSPDLLKFGYAINNKLNTGVENSKLYGVFFLTILNNAINSALYLVYEKLVNIYNSAGYIPNYLVKMQDELVVFTQTLYKNDIRELWILDKKIAVRNMLKAIQEGVLKLIQFTQKHYLAVAVLCVLGFLSTSSASATTNSASYLEKATSQNAVATLAAMKEDTNTKALSELAINTNPNAKVNFIVSHQIAKGDTLESLSILYNIRPEIIAFNNNLDMNTELEVGKNVYIPATNAYIHYSEKTSDIAQISRIYKVSENDLKEYNPGLNNEIEQGKLVFVPVENIDLIKQYKGEEETRLKEEEAKKIAAQNAEKINQYHQRYTQQQRQNALSSASYTVTTNIPKIAANTAFVWPTDTRYISCGWYCYGGHTAIDLAQRGNPPIYAAMGGVIETAASGWNGGYGNYIIINHGNGYKTVYAHLSSINAFAGQYVSQGQVIGRMGNTGNSTGDHLHFEVRLNGGFVHPLSVLP